MTLLKKCHIPKSPSIYSNPSKAAAFLKVEVLNVSISVTEDGPKSVSERELAGLQCIGSYIVLKLHNNFRNHKNWRDIECSKLLVLLELAGQLSPLKSETRQCHVIRRAAICY